MKKNANKYRFYSFWPKFTSSKNIKPGENCSNPVITFLGVPCFGPGALRRLAVAVVFISGILLNYQGINAPYFINDDTDFLTAVNEINFSPHKLYLPLGYVHGPVTLYLTKLSGLLFGENYFGWRVVQYLAMTLILFILYDSAKRVFGKLTAFFSLLLSVFNFFFVFNSKYIGEEIYFILFNAAAIRYFLIALMEKKEKYMILSGIMLGFGLLTKVTTFWLIISLITYISLNKKEFSFLCRRTWLIAVSLVIILNLPYLYWIIKYYPSLAPEYAGGLFGMHRYFNVLFLFAGYFIKHNKAWLDYNFGWNILGPIQGLVVLSGIIYCFKIRGNKYINLLKTIFLTTLFISLFIFSGKETEPRHFSPLIIISIFAGAIFLERIWKKNLFAAGLVIIILSAISLETIKYVSGLEGYYYPLHSKLYLSSWNMEKEKVNLNDMSREFIRLSSFYDPTLIIFPSLGLDSAAHFVAAYTKKKTMSALFLDKYLHYSVDDLKKIVVFITPEDDPNKYIRWALARGYNYSFKEDSLSIFGYSLPIKILYMAQGEAAEEDVEALKLITF